MNTLLKTECIHVNPDQSKTDISKNLKNLWNKILDKEKISNKFTGALIITKNFEDTLEYYKIFRKFDYQNKFQAKKFGNLDLNIKGNKIKTSLQTFSSCIVDLEANPM